MMCIRAAQIVDMTGYLCMVNESLKEFVEQVDIEVTNVTTYKRNLHA